MYSQHSGAQSPMMLRPLRIKPLYKHILSTGLRGFLGDLWGPLARLGTMTIKMFVFTICMWSGKPVFHHTVAACLLWISFQIERIQHPGLYRQYMNRKVEMDRVNGHNPSNERRLWHGTSGSNIDNISNRNFNRSYGGVHGIWLSLCESVLELQESSRVYSIQA